MSFHNYCNFDKFHIFFYWYFDDIRFFCKVSARRIQHDNHNMRKNIVGNRFKALRRSGNVFNQKDFFNSTYMNPKKDHSKKVSLMNESDKLASKPKFLRYNTAFSRLLKLVLDMSEREQMRLLEYAKSIIDERTLFRNLCLIRANCTLKDRTFDGLILDINSYGAYVDTNEPCPIGQEIYLSFYNPFSYKNMDLGGKIIWSSNHGIGVNFNDLSRARYIW